jgi:nucleoid-associated protein EbfC
MNIQKMMKEAAAMQARLQQEMARAQEQLAGESLEGSSGGGLVKIVVNGHKQPLSITIDPKAVDPQDVETLQDLVYAALQSALEAADARSAEVMAQVQGGMGLPPGLDLGGMLG